MPDYTVPEIPPEQVDYRRRIIGHIRQSDKLTPEAVQLIFTKLITILLNEFGLAREYITFTIGDLHVFAGYLPDPRYDVNEVIARVQEQISQPGLTLKPDARVTALQHTVDDPLYPQQWALATIKAEPAWDRVAEIRSTATAPQPPVKVAIIDSGIKKDHEDFDQTTISGKRIIPPASNTNFADDIGHGTMLAGTIAAVADNDRGIAGEARAVEIIALQFNDARTPGTSLAAVLAILEAITRGANIINASWHLLDETGLLKPAIEYAGAQHCLVVVAAGNYGSDNMKVPVLPATYSDLANMIVVMASDEHDQKCWFSNYGANVDLAAPGVRVLTTGLYYSTPAYREYGGTSAAAAHVTAAAALLLAIDYWEPHELREHLMASAEPVRNLEGICGAEGRLDLRRAVLGPFSVHGPSRGRLHRGSPYTVVWQSEYPALVVPEIQISFINKSNNSPLGPPVTHVPNVGWRKVTVPNQTAAKAIIRVRGQDKNLYADSPIFQIT
jgi:subtilisin family serine protease